MHLFSPAKINLFLRVLGKRPDGYHEIASLFQAIDLGDQITLTFSTKDTLTCTDPHLPCDDSNLITKALTLFRRQTGLNTPIAIHLEKKIPSQAGLGGGSSNAATTLWGLNALHDFPFSEHELQAWSATIGSDVPFFFSKGTAYCTGRGEKVRDLLPLNLPPLSLIKPSVGLATLAIFQALRLKECSTLDPDQLLHDFVNGKHRFVNDLEIPAFRLCPPLAQIKEKHPTAFMTGSGSTMVILSGNTIKPLRRLQGWYSN
jgi:4-diphosphocytidyl-2-C-methyl-D-erythritol kinase